MLHRVFDRMLSVKNRNGWHGCLGLAWAGGKPWVCDRADRPSASWPPADPQCPGPPRSVLGKPGSTAPVRAVPTPTTLTSVTAASIDHCVGSVLGVGWWCCCGWWCRGTLWGVSWWSLVAWELTLWGAL
jgi:hypothetical protein